MALSPPPEVVFAVYEIPVVGLEIDQSMVTVLGALALVVLVGLSAFFSSSEIALFSIPKHRVEAMAEDGIPGAARVKALKEDPHRLLVTILVGNNIVNIAMSSIATALLGLYFGGLAAVTAATLGITAIVLLFGESAPKSYAVENTESWSIRVARPLKLAERLMLPLVVLFDYLTRQINRLTGSTTGAIETPYVTRDEIQEMIESGEREGVLEEEEHEMLQRIFRFDNTIVKEVMTPRLDMTAVPKNAEIDETIETCIQSGHARVPVYEGSLDNVQGVVHIRDLVRDLNYGESENDELELADLIQPTLHVPESKNVDELLTEMRENRMHMAIVIDEFGTTEGLVTMEDMIEEIIGEILEGGEEQPIEEIDDDTVLVRGEVNIEDVNESLEIDLPEGQEFETIAGFIFNRAGRLVEEGEEITYDGVRITVETVENTRIMKARLKKLEIADAEPGPDEEAGESPLEIDERDE
ncbi:hemolysin family protein [Natrinema soli]|uniref:Hemolysin family protein n=1 Tax=Natrinema soli TaxID=1930624 RepID=A0ABD5SUY7_9EURY|nr:hemolysin family protein [Natrinema soli]